jgi:hypothetical protein
VLVPAGQRRLGTPDTQGETLPDRSGAGPLQTHSMLTGCAEPYSIKRARNRLYHPDIYGGRPYIYGPASQGGGDCHPMTAPGVRRARFRMIPGFRTQTYYRNPLSTMGGPPETNKELL